MKWIARLDFGKELVLGIKYDPSHIYIVPVRCEPDHVREESLICFDMEWMLKSSHELQGYICVSLDLISTETPEDISCDEKKTFSWRSLIDCTLLCPTNTS